MPPTAGSAIVAISAFGGRVLYNGRIAALWQLFATPLMSGIVNSLDPVGLRSGLPVVDRTAAALSPV